MNFLAEQNFLAHLKEELCRKLIDLHIFEYFTQGNLSWEFCLGNFIIY